MNRMEEALGIVGWVSSDDVGGLRGGKGGDVALWSDAEDERVEIHVDSRGIKDVRVGQEKGQKTFVQLIIDQEDRVSVNTKVRAPDGFTPFTDPVLANLSARALVTVIMI